MSGGPVFCLMGPTASGKTDFAIKLLQRFPMDIISVDSTLVYRGMDIGTAKPDAVTLQSAPHRLIDIRDPEQAYSAGEFVADSLREIDSIHQAGRVPLLVGGTMMYFRSLTEGLADLPRARPDIRQQLDEEARRNGWPKLHARLERIDSVAAKRINENDAQRIQRALEVFEVSGKTLTEWHEDATQSSHDKQFIKLALIDTDRKRLHERINARLESMLDQGFVDEVRGLMQREGLSADSPSMRAVGYRQIWAYLAGEHDRATAVQKALVATRQLAKRQMTWLRSEKDLIDFNPLESGTFDSISAEVTKQLDE